MPARSLRLRMLAFAFAGTFLALAVAGAGLVALFSRHVERRAAAELDNTIAAIAASLAFEPAGTLRIAREPSDPAYRTPLSGRYWQAQGPNGAPLRSLSLWDEALPLAADAPPAGQPTTLHASTEGGQPIILRETTVLLKTPGGERPVRLAAALATEELDRMRGDFARDLLPALIAFGLIMVAGAWFQVRAGLRPLAAVRDGVQRIQSGAARQLDTAVPAEVAPLVEEINGLLEHREQEAERARHRAADLAHGLKTPLTALLADVERLGDSGGADAARDIAEGAAQMRRAVERELARARVRPLAGGGGVPVGVSVETVAAAVARTLSRTPQGERIAISVMIGGDVTAAVDVDDLHDVLGNLMENAQRAASRAVNVAATVAGGLVTLSVDDDGVAADPEAMARLTARGARLDERGGGAGLGLAIVGDILAAYDSVLRFSRSPLGGLRVSFSLPARAAWPEQFLS